MVEPQRTTEVLDPAALENLRIMVGGDDAFLLELVDTFLDDAPGLLADMRRALEEGDIVLLRRSAHSLKSNSAEFGATDLHGLCRELEDMAKAGALDGTPAKIAQVEVEYERVRSALRALSGD
jgi:HPt (histidine-containing phosphotransfer) domain-containing protein